MKQIRIAGLCLVVAFALGAVAATSALAEAPEYGRCVKVAKGVVGKFSTAKCITAATPEKHGFEWIPGAGKTKFTTTGGVGVLTSINGTSVECKTETSGGEFKEGNNKEAGGIFVKFNECISLSLPCNTPGQKSGELITNELEALVGWEHKALKKTALELHPAKSVASGLFIEFECSGAVVKVRGNVLVPIKNDAMKSEETLKFVAKAGIQKPTKWEGTPETAILEASFKGGPFEQSGQNIISKLKELAGEEKLELNAVV